MRLTKLTSYALRILTHCALHPDERVRAAEIAKAYNITDFNVLKIVPLLVHGGLIKTSRGRNGGLRLARPASEISIGEVVRLTEETHLQADCFGQNNDGCLVQKAAPINRILDTAMRSFIDVLDQHTVQDLITQRRSGRPARPDPSLAAALDQAERAG